MRIEVKRATGDGSVVKFELVEDTLGGINLLAEDEDGESAVVLLIVVRDGRVQFERPMHADFGNYYDTDPSGRIKITNGG